jgi:hypothetical protein
MLGAVNQPTQSVERAMLDVAASLEVARLLIERYTYFPILMNEGARPNHAARYHEV